ncbi:MAG: hypothetical protein MUE42_02640 [Opitutaceae bacterium]|jgi:hypothetical protein|nr:hypothetical protein [Opitutaceae bacterium]
MNKTLLLILCDFLLLTLLALTRWEDATPAPPARTASPTPVARAYGGGAATPEQDMVAVMRLSLEDEQARRDALATELAQTEAERQAVERARAELAANLERTEKTAAELGQDLAATRATAEAGQARAAQLARELAAREAEAKRREDELTRVAAAEAAARTRAEELAVRVGVVAREKELLQEQATTLRAAVEAERAERQRVQATATELAVGVGQIAERTGELTRELRDARPINANTLFSDYLARRVRARFVGERSTFLGPITRNHDTHTVLASDGKDTVALLHVDDTPFDWTAAGQPDWAKLVLVLSREQGAAQPARLAFTSLDPRLVVVPLAPEEAVRLGGTPYLLALDPFKFPEAVIISSSGRGYGEMPFKLDPATPGYVKVDNRLVRRLFGDFSPARGDLVLSKTGELLGVMVSPTACVLVTNFLPQRELALGGDLSATLTSPVLEAVAKRFQLLPGAVK